MIILFNVLTAVILGIVLFLGLRAISVGLDAKSKIRRPKPTRKRKR